MAQIKPFQATRYSEKKFPIPPVTPPYDVISEEQRQKMAEDSFSIIHLDKPGAKGDESKYERAKNLLQEWKNESVLTTDPNLTFYAYEQEYTVPEQATETRLKRHGVYALLKLEDYDKKVVLPHEKTLTGPKIDRMKLLESTKTNLSPIFGLYHDETKMVENAFEKIRGEETIYDTVTDHDGTTHKLWKVENEDFHQDFIETLKDKIVMIADGHHRYETSLQYSKVHDEEGAQYILVCLTNFADDGLVVLPTHRLFQTKLSSQELVEGLSQYFDLKKVTLKDLETLMQDLNPQVTKFGFYEGETKQPYELSLKEDFDYGALMPQGHTDEWKQLNVNLIFYTVFKDLLKLSEEQYQADVSYSHSYFETIEKVNEGEFPAAFILQAINKFKVKEISESGELMPQKSTYFFPKLFTGFVLYEHDVILAKA